MAKRRMGLGRLRVYRDNLCDLSTLYADLPPMAFAEAFAKAILQDEDIEEAVARLADDYGFDGDSFRRFSLGLTRNGQKLLFTKKVLEARILTVARIIAKMEEAEQTEPDDLVACVDIEKVVRKRSDSIARTLKSLGRPVITKAHRYYCSSADAAVAFPAWRDYLKQQQKTT